MNLNYLETFQETYFQMPEILFVVFLQRQTDIDKFRFDDVEM
jgi:hypothetical protein